MPGGGDRPTIDDLRVALSGPQVLERLRRHWPYAKHPGRRLERCRVAAVFDRGADGFVVDYRIDVVDGGKRRVDRLFAELVPSDPAARADELLEQLRKKRRNQLSRRSETDRVGFIPDPPLVLRFHGLDEHLDGLKLTRKTRFLKPILSKHLAGGADVSEPEIELLGHRPGRRCVLRFRVEPEGSERRSIVGKLYPFKSGRGERAFATMCELAERGFGAGEPVRIPRPVAFLPEWELVLMEDVAGDPSLDGAPHAAEAAGRAAAHLHGLDLRPADDFGPDDEVAILESRVALVEQTYPDRAAPLREELDRLRPRLAECARFSPSAVHRDFHPEQIVISGGVPVVLDFDTLCLSDPAIDVGNYLAALDMSERNGQAGADEARTAFMAGYREVREPGPGFMERVLAYRRSSFLRMLSIAALTSDYRPAPPRPAEPS